MAVAAGLAAEGSILDATEERAHAECFIKFGVMPLAAAWAVALNGDQNVLQVLDWSFARHEERIAPRDAGKDWSENCW